MSLFKNLDDYQPHLIYSDLLNNKKPVENTIKPQLETIQKEPEPIIKIEYKQPTLLNYVWFEKYRVNSFKDIVGQDKNICSIMAKLDNLPHMILEGPAGTGKTSIIRIIAKELNADLLELNSSDERGINTIRTKVLNFVKYLSIHNSLKIVFFDESDGMSPDAQDCLKAIIEKYSRNVRFIFACNDIKKIIQPLKSRCKTYTFESINQESIIKRLKVIADQENLNLSDNILKQIADNSKGDMRTAINDIQSYQEAN